MHNPLTAVSFSSNSKSINDYPVIGLIANFCLVNY